MIVAVAPAAKYAAPPIVPAFKLAESVTCTVASVSLTLVTVAFVPTTPPKTLSLKLTVSLLEPAKAIAPPSTFTLALK